MSNKRIMIFGWASSVHVQRWTKGMASRGYDIRLVSTGEAKVPQVDTVTVPFSSKLSYFTQAGRALHHVRSFKPDLVHAHYATGFGYWLARVKNVPTLLSVWGSDVIDFPSNALNRSLVRWVLRRATHLTATSHLLKRVSIEILPEAEDKISIIPFGVKIPEEVQPPPDGPTKICYLKVLSPKYGPDILLKAIAVVRDEIRDVRLTIAGEGLLREKLDQMVVDLGLQKHVSFVGFVPNNEIYGFIRDHHFMVMPSTLDSESFGVAVIEAGACGRAVIASDVGGVPEVIDDGRTGILVPPGDVAKLAGAIVKLCREPNLCKEMGSAGYEFVREKYDWERSLDSMAELYDRLIYEDQAQ